MEERKYVVMRTAVFHQIFKYRHSNMENHVSQHDEEDRCHSLMFLRVSFEVDHANMLKPLNRKSVSFKD